MTVPKSSRRLPLSDSFIGYPLLLDHRSNRSVVVVVHNRLSGTLAGTDTAGGTLVIVNKGKVIFDGNGTVGTILFTQSAGDTAHTTVGLCNGTLLLAGTGEDCIRGIGHKTILVIAYFVLYSSSI